LGCELNRPPCGGSRDNGKLCRWVGGLGHLLGLAFDLSHPLPGTCRKWDPDCEFALMWLGYREFPNAYLRPSEKRSLLNSPSTRDFFQAVEVSPVEPCKLGCPGATD
jgi:hypothetical protein